MNDFFKYCCRYIVPAVFFRNIPNFFPVKGYLHIYTRNAGMRYLIQTVTGAAQHKLY